MMNEDANSELQNPERSALVIGGNGIVGSNMLRHLAANTKWRLHSVARSYPESRPWVNEIAVDLFAEDAAQRALAELSEVHYVFFAALAIRSTVAEQVKPNMALLRNSVSPIFAPSKNLKHVCVVQGTKWYGSHLGPYKTPASERDPRHEGPDFYFNQHDWLSEAQKGKVWTYSTLRPHFVSGFNVGNTNNMIMALGAYAAVQRELGLPLDFPGTEAAFTSLTMATDVSLLNSAMLWAATTARCANQDFNINNGDYFRWRNIWPRIAELFGMKCGQVSPLNLSKYMKNKQAIWDSIVLNHALRPLQISSLVSWEWANFLFRGEWDDISSTTKARSFGFDLCIDTEEEILSKIETYRSERILP